MNFSFIVWWISEYLRLNALVIGLTLVGLLILFIFRRSKSSQNPRSKSSTLPKHHLTKRLLLLLHGNTDAAERLLTAAYKKYPHRSKQWYLEKVIRDLERDRR